MLQFLCAMCGFAFLSTFRLSNRTLKITQMLTLYQANEYNISSISLECHLSPFSYSLM